MYSILSKIDYTNPRNIVGLFLFGLLLVSFSAQAQVNTPNIFDGIVADYRTAAGGWEAAIATAARRLFFALVALDLIWMGIQLMFKKSDFLEFTGTLVQRILIIGFFLTLLENGSNWSSTIISSFRELAGNAGGVPTISPSSVMDAGIRISVNLIGTSSIFNVPHAVISGLISIGILVVFALLTAELIIVLISSFIILNGGIIMLAFGGSRWTQQFAINYYKTVLAIGVRLFIIQLLIGLGVTLVNNYARDLSDSPRFVEIFVVAGAVIILYLLVKSISSLVQSLISGSGDTSTGGTGALIGAALGAGAAAAALGNAGASGAQSAAGAAQAVNSASNLASQGISGSGGQTTAQQAFSKIGGTAFGSQGAAAGEALGLGLSKVAGTISELGKGVASDYGSRIRGDIGAESGSAGGRIASRLNDQIELNKLESENAGEQAADGQDDNDNYISGVPDTDK